MKHIERNTNYDFLRFIGISCIILAHMGTPAIIFQARNFDVPLMVLLSGISFSKFSVNHFSSYSKYLYSRFLRLVLPTWLFLIFYNSISYLGSNEIPSARNIIMQFALLEGSGIGIWIIRIFTSLALVAPFLYYLNKNIKSEKMFFIFIAMTYVLYELALLSSKSMLNEQPYMFAEQIVFPTVPYSLLFLYGLRISSLNKTTIQFHLFIFTVIFASYVFVNFVLNQQFVPTQEFKYPPRLYYLSYSLLVSVSLYYLVNFKKIVLAKSKLFQFIGRSTLWIYLWHYFFIKVYHDLEFDYNFLYKWALVYAVTIVMVYLQTKFVHLINEHISPKNSQIQINFFTKVLAG